MPSWWPSEATEDNRMITDLVQYSGVLHLDLGEWSASVGGGGRPFAACEFSLWAAAYWAPCTPGRPSDVVMKWSSSNGRLRRGGRLCGTSGSSGSAGGRPGSSCR